MREQRTYATRLLVQSGKRKRRLLEANSSPQKYQTISPKKIETDNTPDETRMHIIIKWENTKYKVLVDTGATHSYISKEFFKQTEKLIVANGQKLEISGQVLIPIEAGHIKKYLLFRLVPELRSTGILGTETIERLGLKLDFEKENWWLPEKPQIKYKIETNSKENNVRENEEEKGKEPRKESQEEKKKLRDKTKLQNQEEGVVDNIQRRKILTTTTINHTRPETNQINKTKESKLPVKQWNRSLQKNKESENEEPPVEEDQTKNEKCEEIIELNEHQGQQLRKVIERKVNKTGIKLKPTHMTEHKINVQSHEPIKQRYYHVSPKVREYVYEEIDKMLEEDIIEHLYPIPIMTEILDALRSAKYISKIDLRSAYHEIPLEKQSKKITAFTVPGKGMYQFKRMQFRLTNAPATFQRLMDKVITLD